MNINMFTEENKTIYQSTSKEKELSTGNSPLAAPQGKSTPEPDIISKKQMKPLNSSKEKTKTLSSSYNKTPQEDSLPAKTTGLTDMPKRPAIGTLGMNSTPNTTSYNKQKANL